MRDNLLVAAYPIEVVHVALDMLHLTPKDQAIEDEVDWSLEIMGLTDEAIACQPTFRMVNASSSASPGARGAGRS